MNRVSNIFTALVICTLTLAAGFTPVQAATINVAVGDDINAKITSAAVGDTLLFAPGTYAVTATVNVNKEGLILLSSGGSGSTIIQYSTNTDNTPVITIAAPGVTIGGPGQGFTIRQNDAGANTPLTGNCAIKIDGSTTGNSVVTIRNNVLEGLDADVGILVNPDMTPANVQGGFPTLNVTDNSFSMSAGGTTGFDYGIYFYYHMYPAPLSSNISAYDMTINITGNTMTLISDEGVYFDDDVYKSNITITGNSFSAYDTNADGAVYFNDDITTFSNVNVSNNTGSNWDYFVYVGGYLTDASNMTVSGNSCTHVDSEGIYIYPEYGSTLAVTDNSMSVDGENGDYGLELDCEYGCQTTVTGNNLNGFTSYGIYVEYSYSGSTLIISNNTIRNADGGGSSYGIYTDTEYGSSTRVTNNDVRGFDYCGIYENYPEYGSTYVCENNIVDALDSSGADYGIWVDETSYGCTALVNNNTVKDFNYAGFYFGSDVYYNSTLTITNNTFTGYVSSTPDYGIYFSSDVYEGATAIVTGNTCTGHTYAGFYCDNVYSYSRLQLDNNTFTSGSGGADYGIYMYDIYYHADGTINNNTISGCDEGIEQDYCDDFASCQMNGNRITANYSGANYGIYAYEAYDSAVWTLNNNVIDGFSDGIYTYDVYDGSAMTVDGNTITGFDDSGFYLDYVEYGSVMTCTNNTMAAATGGAYYGIYSYDFEYGPAVIFTGNTISGFGNQGGSEAGFYNGDYFGYEGTDLTISGNTFTAHSAGSEYGFYSDSGLYYGCNAVVSNNTFSGFTGEGLYSYYVEDACDFTIANNTFTAHSSGCDYGIDIDDAIDYGSHLVVTGNTVSGQRMYGLYFYNVDDGSGVLISGNTFTGNASGCQYGIYAYYSADYGSDLSMLNNSITNIVDPDGVGDDSPYDSDDAAGIFIDDETLDGGSLTICGNTITGSGAGDNAGIILYYAGGYGATIDVCRNTVSGFPTAGLVIDDDNYDGNTLTVDRNSFTGGKRGIWWDGYNMESGTIESFTGNAFNDFTETGMLLDSDIYGCKLTITGNKFKTGSADVGIDIQGTISSAADVEVHHNCFQGPTTGIKLVDILDTAGLNASANDFAGVSTGVDNTAGDAAHTVNAENSYWTGSPVNTGQVDADPVSATPTDADGDGVADCEDTCPDTAAGETADASGCSCQQNNPAGDSDGDGVLDCVDNCPNTANADQADSDGNGIGDACETPTTPPAGACGLCGGGGGLMVPMTMIGIGLFGRRRIRRGRKGISMNKSARILTSVCLMLAVVGVVSGETLGATINVSPGDDINAKITSAAVGDTLLFASGTYTVTATVNINKANLIFLSSAGAASTEIVYATNTDNTPVITIAAPGITIGGPGQGFKITQNDVGANTVNGNACIKIDGSTTGSSTITIRDCTLQGDQADQGILVNPDLTPADYSGSGAVLNVIDNTFQRSGAAFSFRNAIELYYHNYGAPISTDLSAFDATITITGNVMTFIENCGVLFDEQTYKSVLNISNNNMTSTSNGYVGIYGNDYWNNLSTATVNGNTIAGFDYPIYYYIENLSTATVSGNTISGHTYQGIYGYADYGSTQTISGNTITGTATADTGIETDTEYGASSTVTGNTISSVQDYGCYEAYPYSGSTYTCTNNTITMLANAGSGYGIYLSETEYDSHSVITGNTVKDFDYAGFYEGYPYAGSTTLVENNTFDGLDATGATYGIYMDYPEYGSTATVNNNTVKDYNYAGFYNAGGDDHAILVVTNNTFTGWATTPPDYGIYVSSSFYYGSALTINNNTATGFDQYGIYVSDMYENLTFACNNNTLTGAAATMPTGIYVSDGYDGFVGTIQGNTISNFNEGIDVDYVTDGGTLDIAGNTLTANIAASTYGIYMYEIYDGGAISVRNNRVTVSKGDGIYFDDYADDGATLLIDGNTVSGWDNAGIYAYEFYDGALCTISNNTLTADSGGAYYGIFNYEVDDGAEMNVINNTASGYGNKGGNEAGFWNDYEFYDGVHFTMTGNTFTAHSAGSEYGFYSDNGFDYGCTGVIANNTFTGFSGDGLYNYYCEDGSNLTVANNTFTAIAAGCDDGLYFDDGVDYGSRLTVTGNTVTGAKTYGIYNYEANDGSTVEFSGNTVTGHTDGCEYGFYNEYDDYGSVFNITNNSFTNIKGPAASDGYGMYPLESDYVNDGSEMTICGNTITCLEDGDSDTYGIYLNYVVAYGSYLNICNNAISGQNYAGIYYNDDAYEGGSVDTTGNSIAGGQYALYWDASYDIEPGSTVNIRNNRLVDFTGDGFYFGGTIYGAIVNVTGNRFITAAADTGVKFEDSISSASDVTVTQNCFKGMTDGIWLKDVLDTAILTATGNDFFGVGTHGVNNTAGDAAHKINAENCYWLNTPFNAGEVDADPALASAPDSDGDGVSDCDDSCPGTTAGASVDASGCSCEQLTPTADADGDGVTDCNDNCPNVANPDQADSNGNGIGDACETPTTPPAGTCGLCGGGGGLMVPATLLGLGLFGRRAHRRRR